MKTSAFTLLPGLVLTSCVLAACGGVPTSGTEAAVASPWLKPSTGAQNAASGSAIERYFPLVDGMVYRYDTENEAGEKGILVARVHRTDAHRGELHFPSGVKAFEIAADGLVVHGRGGETSYVLKLPLETGTSWRGEHGGQSRIINAAAVVETPAGKYEGCVQTLEERLGDRPVRYSTTFCPDVGVVQLDVGTGINFERASLRSYGPPMRMREDGIDKLPPGAPEVPGQ